MSDAQTLTPWYKQFWPWFLIGLPAAAVIASMHMLYVAATGADQLVRQDYYKDGLAINERLALIENAEKLGVQLRATFVPETGSINLTSSQLSNEQPLTVELIHPLYQQADQVIELKSIDGIEWRGDLKLQVEGRRYIWVYQGDEWLIKGEAFFADDGEATLWVSTNQ